MQQWDRDTSGRLNRISTQLDLASEVSVQTDTMDPIPEEQQSQPGTPMNPNAYRTMRDHIHPPRVSAPSCIIPPADDVAVRPYLVPLLPTYHGMENENPYTHLRDFEEVCTTFKEGMMNMDLLKLKAFPLTLKDKAKIWLNSLRPRTIRNWAELQAEFLKKFFSAHKTNNLKRQIYTFAAHEGEKFYQCWERFMETSSACPHHGFDTWMLVNHFYDGMSPPMKQLVETMCGGNFLSKHPDEAIYFLNYVAETSKAWDEPRPREDEGLRHPSYQGETIHTISEDTLMKEKLTILTRRLDEMEMKNQHNIYSVNELSASQPSCYNHQSHGHHGENCQENVQILNQGRPPMNVPFGNSYIQNWKNHSNLPGKPYKPPIDQQQFAPTSQQQQPIPLSPVEQAILNLSKMVGTIMEEQKVLNVQTSKKFEALESSVDRKLDNMHSEISKLSNQQLQSSEKERVPSQGQQYQNMVNEICLTEDTTTRTDEVKAVVTLRSGRELKTAVPELVKPAPVVTVQANQETETVESSLNNELDGFQSEIDQKLDILQESISNLTNQFVHQEEENLEEESLTEPILVEQAQLQPQEELKVELVEAPPEELQDTPESGDTFWPWKKEEQTSALISEEESQEEECLSDTMVGEQCQQHLLLEPSDIGATFCPWENHTALFSEEINGKEPGEVPKKNVIQPNPIDLDTTATAQDTKYPLPVAPSVDQVYILPSPAPQPTPATKSKPAAPAPKAKSNPSLHAMQNFKRLVAYVHKVATTSKAQAAAYTAWHSGWFWCGFGFGASEPLHF